MKFRNPETGEIFNTIFAAREKFCHGKWCEDCLLPSTIRPGFLPDDSGGCYEFCMKHPIKAAHLMGYEVIPEPGDDTASLSTVVKAFNQIGEDVNMGKPRICEVLGVEVNEVFLYKDANSMYRINDEGKREYFFCEKWERTAAEDRLIEIINHPEHIIRKPRFTQQEVEKAKNLLEVVGPIELRKAADIVTMKVDGKIIYLRKDAFPSLKNEMTITLDEIIGNEAQP